MAATGETWSSGSEAVFIEMAMDIQTRDPDRQRTLVCVMDGEQKLWDLQREWLGHSVEILDLFHALNTSARSRRSFSRKTKNGRRSGSATNLRDLLTGRVETVIRRWRRLAREAELGNRWTKDNQNGNGGDRILQQ